MKVRCPFCSAMFNAPKEALDKDKLIAHLQTEWKKKWDDRFEQASHTPNYREAYMDGALDIFEVLLTFEEDLQLLDSMMALLETMKRGEG